MTRADWGAGWAGGARALKRGVLCWQRARAGRLLRGLSGSRGRPVGLLAHERKRAAQGKCWVGC